MHTTFEHQADIGVRGTGKTLEQAFEECAKAMFTVMADIENIKPEKSITGKTTATDHISLLVCWLNDLLAYKDIENMILAHFKTSITRQDKQYTIEWEAKGETINPKNQEILVEVKAATFHQALVKQEKGEWTAQCIVDV